jgi:hypothetical protein
MMKQIRFILITLISSLGLLAACTQILDSPESQTREGTGQVLLNVSAGAGNARTILPEETPEFSRYELAFTGGSSPINVSATSGEIAGGLNQELDAGTWTVTVRAYRNFTPTYGTENEYLAAEGTSQSFTVSAGQITPVSVALTPIAIDASAPVGIFTYKVSFPADVTYAQLNYGGGYYGLSSGETVSVEIAPGYYDLSIFLRKGPLTAGTTEKVHIYSGLESKAEFTFDAADFVQPAPLSADTWTEGNLSTWGQVHWYTFDAVAGVTYNLQWDSGDDGTGTYTGGVAVEAYGSNGSYLGGGSSGYSSPRSISRDTNDTIYVGVYDYNTGTYAIRYYDASTQPPIAPTNLQMWIPQPDYTITWNSVGGADEYRVSRSPSETGVYSQIGTTSGTSFTDTGTSSGTYWYKVRAVNGHGEGPDSTPVEVVPVTPLSSNTWTEGDLTSYGQVDWYSFSATASVTYYLQWDSVYDGTDAYTGGVYVVAYSSNGGWSGNSGYSSPLPLDVDTNDTIYVKVGINGTYGTYAIRYYDPSTLPPQIAPAYVQMGIPQPDYTITWNSVAGATGYTVYRSTSETGEYSQVGTTSDEYSASFTDTGTSSGTYWYKVSAVNDQGEGPDSAPVAPPTPLTYDTWMEGNLTTGGQANWYSFSAAAGVTYYLQWDDNYEGTGTYAGDLMVSAYRSNGSSIFMKVDSGYNSPKPFTLEGEETVYVKVEPYGNQGNYTGPYAIRYYQ